MFSAVTKLVVVIPGLSDDDDGVGVGDCPVSSKDSLIFFRFVTFSRMFCSIAPIVNAGDDGWSVIVTVTAPLRAEITEGSAVANGCEEGVSDILQFCCVLICPASVA